MNQDKIQERLNLLVEKSEWNYIKQEEAILDSLVGVRLFAEPLVGCATVDDPLFIKLREPEVIGPHVMLPEEWLTGAKSVISIFYPFTEAVRSSNRQQPWDTSPEWLHGRIEGQRFVEFAARQMIEFLQQNGYQAVVPAIDSRFRAVKVEPAATDDIWKGKRFTSNWSERHAAFICGLGTFGLSKGLITAKGIAGRFSSIITDALLEPTARPYTDIYEYCIRCGACVRNCPVQAITLERGKDHTVCGPYVMETGERYAPRYGCGKCQVDVPCEFRNPSAKR